MNNHIGQRSDTTGATTLITRPSTMKVDQGKLKFVVIPDVNFDQRINFNEETRVNLILNV